MCTFITSSHGISLYLHKLWHIYVLQFHPLVSVESRQHKKHPRGIPSLNNKRGVVVNDSIDHIYLVSKDIREDFGQFDIYAIFASTTLEASLGLVCR